MERDSMDFLSYGIFENALNSAVSNLRSAIFRAEHVQEESGMEMIDHDELEKLKLFLKEIKRIKGSSFHHFLQNVPSKTKPETEAA